MVCQSLKQECRVKCFGFIDFQVEDFAKSQWNIGQRKFLAYRALVFSYWTIFLFVDFATNQNKGTFCLYLSHWNEAQLALFFGFALFCAVRYVWKMPKAPSSCGSSNSASSSSLTNESATKLTGDCRKQKVATITMSGGTLPGAGQVRLRWYHGLTTMLYVTSLSISVAVTFLYAFFEMGKSSGDKQMSAGNFHLHFVNSLLILTDFFLNCIPIRLLHFIYVSIFTVLYCSLLFVLHVTGVNSAMYKIVDWKRNTAWAIAFSIGMIFLIAPATHTGMYFLQRGVRFLSSRTTRKTRNVTATDEDNEDLPQLLIY